MMSIRFSGHWMKETLRTQLRIRTETPTEHWTACGMCSDGEIRNDTHLMGVAVFLVLFSLGTRSNLCVAVLNLNHSASQASTLSITAVCGT